MGRPNQTHERLDALLDGHTGEVTDDLAPLLEAAESLRTELAQFELDPRVANRHLERVLNGSAPVVTLPVGQRVGGLRHRVVAVARRRVVAVALAAALVLVPATMASAASSDALPGQALYPVKLAVEQVRLASVQWSATREAAERTRLAGRRLQELDKLVDLEIFSQVPPAIQRLDQAVEAAREAVEEAVKEEGLASKAVAEVANEFFDVSMAQHNKLQTLAKEAPKLALPPEIVAAVNQSPALEKPISTALVTVVPPSVLTATSTPTSQPEASPPSGSGPDSQPAPSTTAAPTPSSAPAPSAPTPSESSTTAPPTTAPTTTTLPASGGGSGSDSGGAGADGAGAESPASSVP